MGNEMSHKRYWCRKSRKFSRLRTEPKTAVSDLPIAQTAEGAVLRCSVNHPVNEKPREAATGLQNKDVGRENGTTSCALPGAQGVVRTTELQELGEAQPSAEQTQEAGKEPPTMTNPDGQAASAQGRPAAAHEAEGDTEVATTALALQPAEEMGAGDVVTEQVTGKSSSVVHRKPSFRVCRPSPFCRWLKKLKSQAEEPKVKPGAVTSQE